MKHKHLLQKISNHNPKPYPRALETRQTDTCPFCDRIVTIRWHFNRTRWSCKECADYAFERRIQARKRSTTQYLKKARTRLIRTATPAERCVMEKLTLAEIPFEFQCIVRYRTWQGVCDFYLTSLQCMLEIDGPVHENDEQQAKDRVKDYICSDRLGKPVIRISNQQAFEWPADRLVKFLTTNYGSEHQAEGLKRRKEPQPYSLETDGPGATAAIQPSIHAT